MPLKKKSFTIKDWDVSDRPREKLKSQGASYLSNAELFAVLIGSSFFFFGAILYIWGVYLDI